MNGRVHILGSGAPDPFSLYDKIPVGNDTAYQNALQGNWTCNKLSEVFFSSQNIQIIQNGIRAGVFKASKGRYKIGPQNEDSLKIIMRSTYLQSALNQPTNITAQVTALNNLVLNYAVPQICSEAEAYLKYKNAVSNLPVPMANPTYVSQTGQYSLEMKPWF